MDFCDKISHFIFKAAHLNHYKTYIAGGVKVSDGMVYRLTFTRRFADISRTIKMVAHWGAVAPSSVGGDREGAD